MRLVEIAGHLIDPGKVSYVGLVQETMFFKPASHFSIVVDTTATVLDFDFKDAALVGYQKLVAAIESRSPCERFTDAGAGFFKPVKHSDYLTDVKPNPDGAIALLQASAALFGIQAVPPKGRPICRDDPGCPKEPDEKSSDALLEVKAQNDPAGPQPPDHHHYYEQQEDGSFKFRWEPDVPGITYAGGQVVRERELEASEALLGVEPSPELRAMPGLDSLMRKESE